MLRLFIAVDIEDPLVVSRLERVKEAIVSTGVPMKPVETHNLHITLRFIGEVDEGLAEEIKRQVLGELRFKRFRARLVGLGAFPGIYRPRVVWAGVGEGSEELTGLFRMLEDRLVRLGLRPEGKGFHPHVTLARVKGSRNLSALVKILEEYRDYEFGWINVDNVRLKKSTLTRQGPIYETLMEVQGE
ncbi:MAG: RNA 2',3'-cyclic phosphodiesterase [Desulfurococcales archaeon]|nr:RNA 2',3'-cyclic phosphodiesterase [Desulfurococcales archaeon]